MKKLKDILLPTSFQLVDTSNMGEVRKREIIKENDEQIVLLKDTHYSAGKIQYLFGKIKVNDEETYSLQLLNQKELKILHYHDLQELLVSSGLPNSVKIKLLSS